VHRENIGKASSERHDTWRRWRGQWEMFTAVQCESYD